MSTGKPSEWDVVVIGAGSAGSVVATRMAQDGADTLLVEAGQDFPNEGVTPPAFFVGGNLYGENYAGAGAPVPQLDWQFTNEPISNGRVLPLTRGKLVGGSSMINAALAVWPKPADLAAWAQIAGPEWSYDALQPYFGQVASMIPIRTYARERWLPFQALWVEAMLEFGLDFHPDLNAPDAWDGVVGAYPQNRRNEVRQGTLVTYLRAARELPNFRLLPDTLVDRLELGDSGITSVRIISSRGEPQQIRARRFVLSAGVYGSAAILQRSGIGAASAITEAGIAQQVELPVGVNLFEHLQTLFLVDMPRKMAIGGFPALSVVSRAPDWASFPHVLDEEAGIGAVAFQLLAHHEGGELTVRSADPATAPRIDHHFEPAIQEGRFDDAWAAFEKVLQTQAMLNAGVRFHGDGLSLPERLCATLATSWHPAGGCAMGSVVDGELRLYGVDNLRVADASVFPHHSSHNPNLTCMVVGEHAADLLISS
jgi:choline dehydrogenase